MDDSFELAEKLKGKAWTSVPAEFIDLHHGDLPLLTPGAFAAFVPAWINRALDDLDDENEVRDFTVYCFSPTENEHPVLAAVRRERIRYMTVAQTDVVRNFLILVIGRERSRYVREWAAKALAAVVKDLS